MTGLPATNLTKELGLEKEISLYLQEWFSEESLRLPSVPRGQLDIQTPFLWPS